MSTVPLFGYVIIRLFENIFTLLKTHMKMIDLPFHAIAGENNAQTMSHKEVTDWYLATAVTCLVLGRSHA